MKLLIVRHAIAEESARGGDAARRLTKEGREKMVKGALALAELVPELELVLTSPLVRARETAEIVVAASSRKLPLVECAALAPGGRASDVLSAVAARKPRAAVAVVGHEPNLSRLEGYLLTGQERSIGELKKGGVALIETPVEHDGAPAAGSGTLLWHLTPAQLRALAP